ncbi:response regulator [Flagellimonas sp. 389]|uniref:ATP-binding protein n=1 Tax=Flagellimonas sp. 389 TaxID=2835862 RepID=UPI001BD2FD33|nr:ATP-binding protein [Flagellimonas sp. 389]MBS9462874.1 response regulator [Flagellimonas sp. 389]
MQLKDFKIIEWGIAAHMPFEHSRKTRLVNVFTLLATGTTLPYLFIFFDKDFGFGLLTLLCFFALSVTWIFNSYGKHHFAKIWLFTVSHIYLFIASSSLGKDSGVYLYLIPVLFSAVLLFEFRERYSLISVVSLNILTYLALEFYAYETFTELLSLSEQQWFYRYNFLVTLLMTAIIGSIYFYLYNLQIKENQLMIDSRVEIEKTVNYFSNSTFGKNTVDEILWDVAKNCIGRLGFVDCVIYLLDDQRQLLVQKAAYGGKNPGEFEIFQPMDIPVGKGIVGHVAKTGEAIIIRDTSQDPRYIADDKNRLSEIAVPLIYNRRVIGVIDSEHPEKDFFTQRHLSVLRTISSLCANKVAKAIADQEREQTIKIKNEADRIKAFEQLKSKLFANVSHEFRTPLTLIMGTIDKNIQSGPNNDWHLIKRHADRLLRLINQLLDLSKIEASEYKLNKESGDIMKFLRITLSLFSSLTYNRQITLKGTIPKDTLWLKFDSDALEKIVFNLLSNAIKFTADHSVVELSAEYDSELILKVSDQGPGISEEEIIRIFDRYYQATKNRNSGTGIGLSLTKELVELHGGTIKIESTLNKGTTFIVSLPLERSAVNHSEKKIITRKKLEENEIVHQTKTDSAEIVLVVEDHQELSDHIVEILGSDYQLLQAHDGSQALDIALGKLPDLIVSDVMMPKRDGFELCQTLKENELTSHIPIILLTAKADKTDKLYGLNSGADDYIVKPFNADELKVRVKNLLAQRKKLKEKFSKISTLNSKDIVITSVDEIFMKKVIATIEDGMHNEDFNVEELCAQIGISRMQMHRKLVALTGKSTSALIRQQRLHRAAKLLESGETSSQTAYAVGFNSLSYFTRVFKEEFGALPSEFLSKQV